MGYNRGIPDETKPDGPSNGQSVFNSIIRSIIISHKAEIILILNRWPATGTRVGHLDSRVLHNVLVDKLIRVIYLS